MVKKLRVHAADLRGVDRLTIASIAGVVHLSGGDASQHRQRSLLIARLKRNRTTGITRLVYRSIHGVVGLVGFSVDRLLARLAQFLMLIVSMPAWIGGYPIFAVFQNAEYPLSCEELRE